MPGRSGAPIVDNRPGRDNRALTSVPDAWPGAGCTAASAGDFSAVDRIHVADHEVRTKIDLIGVVEAGVGGVGEDLVEDRDRRFGALDPASVAARLDDIERFYNPRRER